MAKKGILRINNFGHLSNFTCILRYENFLITSLRHIKHSKYCKCVFLRIACKTTVKIRYANRRVRQTLFALCVALLMFIFNTTESCVNLMKHSSGNHIYSRVPIGAFFFFLSAMLFWIFHGSMSYTCTTIKSGIWQTRDTCFSLIIQNFYYKTKRIVPSPKCTSNKICVQKW